MCRCILISTLVVMLFATPTESRAGKAAVSVSIGTMGLGGSLAYSFGPKLNVRGEITSFVYEPDINIDAIEYSFDLPTMGRALVDFRPIGWFYLSAGAFFSGDINVDATPTTEFEINGVVFPADQVGNLSGMLDLGGVAPYVGFGFGNPVSSFLGVHVDLGVAFIGSPEVTIVADGPISDNPLFIENLQAEAQMATDDVDAFSVYPVLSFGISLGF